MSDISLARFRRDADFAMAVCGGTVMTAADGQVRPVNRPYVTSPVRNDNEPEENR